MARRVVVLSAVIVSLCAFLVLGDPGGAPVRADPTIPFQPSPAERAPATTAPTTTTTVPAAAPPAPPAPPPPAVPPPVPAPVPAHTVATSDPGTVDLAVRIAAAFEEAVPAAWRAAVPTRLRLIGGATSWGIDTGLIEVSAFHAKGPWNHLLSVIAHEFGHLVAFRHGTDVFAGAAPSGWPYSGPRPAEAWADCVAEAFTGIVDPSPGLAACPLEAGAWTTDWLRSAV